MIDLVFFFNGPATTENYTYVHTLALPDALPISRRRLAGQADGRAGKADRKRPRRADEAVRLSLTREGRARRWRRQEGSTSRPGSPRCGPGRSEEHTSELQSLMRISYAVFCLKKKTKPTKTVTQATLHIIKNNKDQRASLYTAS